MRARVPVGGGVVHETVTTRDGVGRPLATVLPTGDLVTRSYAGGGRIVHETADAPTASGSLHRTTRLTAWGDAMVTGMLVAIFVAYRPQWLLTWSDRMYLRRA